MVILAIPADNQGGKLWIKDVRQGDKHLFAKFKSTYNDMPWRETILFPVDDNYTITGTDGTVLFRFNKQWINKLNN